MRNWSNPDWEGSLEEAVAYIESKPNDDGYIWLCGMEVVSVSDGVQGKRRTLLPDWNSLGFAPFPDDRIHIGGTPAEWRVVRVAERMSGAKEFRIKEA